MEGSRSAIGVDASVRRAGLRFMIGVAAACLAVFVFAGAATADAGPLAKATRVQVFRHGSCVLATFSTNTDGQKVYDSPQQDVACAQAHNREDFADFRVKVKQVGLRRVGRITRSVCDVLFRQYTGTAIAAQDTYDIVIYTSNELRSNRRYTCSLAPKGFDIDHSDVVVRGSAKRP